MASFHGIKIQFWLPQNTFVMLLGIKHTKVMGIVRPWTSFRSMQWMAEYRIDWQNTEVVHAAMKNGSVANGDVGDHEPTLRTLIVMVGGSRLAVVGRAVVANGTVEVIAPPRTQNRIIVKSTDLEVE